MLPRHIVDRLTDALADTTVVLVNGARQTGKSTLVQSPEMTGRGRQYLTFDDSEYCGGRHARSQRFCSRSVCLVERVE